MDMIDMIKAIIKYNDEEGDRSSELIQEIDEVMDLIYWYKSYMRDKIIDEII